MRQARRTASGVSVCRQPDAARSAGPVGACRGTPPHPHADAAHGHRRALSPAQHLAPGARAQGFIPICCAAWPSRGPTRSGPWTSPTSRWRAASSIWRRWSTGSAAACSAGGCRSPWMFRSVWRPWKRLFCGMENRKSSTPTRAASSPAQAFTGRLKEEGIRISMDGQGRWRDNVFVERVWKSIKYEEVYLRAYQSVSEARASLGTLHRVLQQPPTALQPEGANARSGILPPPAGTNGSLTQKTDPPLKKRQNLSKEPGPAQCWGCGCCT